MGASSERADQASRSRRRGFVVAEILGLAILWVVFSGKFDVLHLAYGALSIVLVVFLTRHLIFAQSTERENEALAGLRPGRIIVYPFWLLWQIALANIQIAVLILRPKPNLDPVLLDFTFPVDSAVAKVSLGNSITLTPGTFTLRIAHDRFVVHAINRESAACLIDDNMPQRVAGMFGAEIPPTHVEFRHRFLDVEQLPEELAP
jgi:multicomponent Na+:H+ antiporter subunit E